VCVNFFLRGKSGFSGNRTHKRYQQKNLQQKSCSQERGICYQNPDFVPTGEALIRKMAKQRLPKYKVTQCGYCGRSDSVSLIDLDDRARYFCGNTACREWIDPFEIYSLADPRDRKIRYVGLTQVGVDNRVKTGHSGTMASNWMFRLRRCDKLNPLVTVLEVVHTRADAVEAEAFWQEYLRFCGCKLLNNPCAPPRFKDTRPYGSRPWRRS
jgi:hypothetical protein